MRTSTRKRLLVVGAALGGEDVVGLAGAGGLEVLLQGGLVVADGSVEGLPPESRAFWSSGR